jgi:hypothetical protein
VPPGCPGLVVVEACQLRDYRGSRRATLGKPTGRMRFGEVASFKARQCCNRQVGRSVRMAGSHRAERSTCCCLLKPQIVYSTMEGV